MVACFLCVGDGLGRGIGVRGHWAVLVVILEGRVLGIDVGCLAPGKGVWLFYVCWGRDWVKLDYWVGWSGLPGLFVLPGLGVEVLLRGTLSCAGYGSFAGCCLLSYMGLSLKESPVGERLAPRGGTSRPDERNFISFVGGCFCFVCG